MTKNNKPLLGITMGDVAGIGPEVIVRALAEDELYQRCRPVVLGDPVAIGQALGMLKLPGLVNPITALSEISGQKQVIDVLSLSNLGPADLIPGQATLNGARAAASYIETGAYLAINGQIAGLVTAPISKEALHKAGYFFPGHTEMLAHLSGNTQAVMMLAGPRLKVVLVTIHLAFAEVPTRLSEDNIVSTVRITADALQTFFGLSRPRLAVAALNPHAGEGGLFGQEEQTIINPALNTLQRQGIEATGPYPPDTVFYRAVKGEFDVVVCMYHDQGLIPFKLLHFADGVNVTLGLPFIRTSVDHGTAYNLAGTGLASHTSMVAAIKMAAEMAEKKPKFV